MVEFLGVNSRSPPETEAQVKTLREIRAAVSAIENDLKGLCDTVPITATTLITWLALLPVSVLRDAISRIAGMLEPGKP